MTEQQAKTNIKETVTIMKKYVKPATEVTEMEPLKFLSESNIGVSDTANSHHQLTKYNGVYWEEDEE